MADITTLPPRTKEVKLNQMVGRMDDLIGETVELILGGAGSFVNQERPVGASLETINQMAEHRIGEDRPPQEVYIGGKKEIIFNDPEKIRYQESLNVIAHHKKIDQSIDQVTQIHAIEQQARLEAQGMEDGEYAEKAGYKNTGFRGFLFRGLKTIANNFAVRARRAAELFKLVKEKEASGLEVSNKRTSAKGAASGANDMLLNANAQEGNSAIANAVRGSG